MIVVLCDGSSKGNPGPASIGVVAWDRANNPRIILPNYRYSQEIGVRTNMEAEWSALLHAVNYVISKAMQEAYIFSDSQTVVNQANGEWKVRHPNIIPLYQAFCDITQGLSNVHIAWVPRQLVYLADMAARKGGEKVS